MYPFSKYSFVVESFISLSSKWGYSIIGKLFELAKAAGLLVIINCKDSRLLLNLE